MLVEAVDQEAVAKTVKAAVEARGAVVTSWTESETEFEGLKAENGAFTRAGYVGTYQYHGEKDVHLQVRLFALLPERLFWAVVFTELAVVVAFLVTVPAPNLWVISAVVMALVLGGAYWARRESTKMSSELELEFGAYLAEELTAEGAPADIVVQEEQLDELEEIEAIERELRLEATKKELAKTRPAIIERTKGAREKRPPASAKPQDDAEGRRKRLLTLKAELEKKRASRQESSNTRSTTSGPAKP
ncbi:MAG: hypothetical protein HY556_02450 [Euryarchaeota archaeon]|nr:hypothetical protein [Euryarchaeota archaeon]